MSFNVAAEGYDRFMGRFSSQLIGQMADLAGVRVGQRALDVGCGPGVLTTELVARLGAANVAAVEPSPTFLEAARQRNPGVDVRQATAEALPFDDASFDAALAQLVVHFMADPVTGLREMARVTRPGGSVAACVWDLAGGGSPVSLLWSAAVELDPDAQTEASLNGAREGHLGELFRAAGLADVAETTVHAEVRYTGIDEWWEPYMLGVGPAGQYVASLEPDARDALRARCAALLGPPPFTINAFAWAARGTVEDVAR